MRTLTIQEVHALMPIGTLVAHQSEPHVGYKLTPIGNVETHDGRTLNAAEFWYARKDSAFHDGWILFVPPAITEHYVTIRFNRKDTPLVMDTLMASVPQCQIYMSVLPGRQRHEFKLPCETMETALLIERLLHGTGRNFIAKYQGVEFFSINPCSTLQEQLRFVNELDRTGNRTLHDALAARSTQTA